MKKKFDNTIKVEGYVYQHSLEKKTVQNTASENFGKEFINGSVWVATDEDGLNVVEVHYSFVTPTTKKNTANPTYKALSTIMESPTWIENGKAEALQVILSPSIALNDFYDREGKLASPKRAEGGFVTIASATNPINPDPAKRAYFSEDMIVTAVKVVEPDEEKGYDGYAEVRGCIFDFRNAVLPVSFNIREQAGIDYMLDLDASPASPRFLKVWGNIISETTTVEIKEESAFGEPLVKQVKRNHKEWLLMGGKPDTLEFGDENLITAEELKKAMQDREVYLAGVKKRADEYQASKAGGTTAAPAPATVASDGFNF